MQPGALDRLIVRLEVAVKEHGTVKAYAKHLGIPYGTLYAWLTAKCFPTDKYVPKVAAALGMSIEEFYQQIVLGVGANEELSHKQPLPRRGNAIPKPEPLDRAIIRVVQRMNLEELSQLQDAIAQRMLTIARRSAPDKLSKPINERYRSYKDLDELPAITPEANEVIVQLDKDAKHPITQRRLELNLSTKDIAQALDIAAIKVSFWELGEIDVELNKKQWAALARILECDVEELRGEIESLQ